MSKIVHRDSCRCYEDIEAWTVNSTQYHNCFFTYLRHNNRPHTLNEIAKLLGMSIASVTALEKKALAKLQSRITALEKIKKLKGL